VFVILKLDESDFGNELKAECEKIENVAQLDKYCKEKAMTIFEAMKHVVNENSEILKRVAKRFILNKHRAEDDILALSEILKNDLEREKQLNDDEYEALSKLNYVVPLEDMKYLFLYELVFSTLYTHGRRLFYLIEPVDPIKARIFCGYLYISHHISQLTNGQFPKWKCLYSMLTERSGTLQQCIEDRPALQQHNMATFQKVADRCEIMLQEDTRYYVFGVYKMDTKQDEHNQAIWLKQLIRCYRNMLGCAVDQSEKEDVTNKGSACVKRLQESLPSIENRTPFVSIQFSIGEFYDCIGDKNSAEKIFESLTPDVLLSQHEDLTKDKLRKYEKKASILLIKCLCENNKMDMARQLFQRVKLKFQLSHDITELKIFQQIQKDYQLS
jgi:pentatricopeptide repeat protein